MPLSAPRLTRSIRHGTTSVFEAIIPLTFVISPVGLNEQPVAVLCVVEELALVYRSVFIDVLPLTFSSLIIPLALIVGSIGIYQSPVPMDLTVAPITLVKGSIGPYLPTVAVTTLAELVPLTLVYNSSEKPTGSLLVK